MSRVVQSVMISKTAKDEKLQDMFAQMTGAKEADPKIIIPKYNNIRKNALVMVKTLDKLAGNTKLRAILSEFTAQFDEIKDYSVSLRTSLQYDTIKSDEEVTADNIQVLYKTCKEDPNIRMISVLCSRLRQDMTPINDLNIYFIGNQSDNNYQPFPFTTLNFTNVWTELPESDSGGDIIKKYIMTVLKKLMECSYEIHNTLISPDIDIDEFSHILVEAITKARNMLPRCKQAFDKIEDSITLLKSNFSDYYKSFMISKNPNSIFELFIVDVFKSQKGSLRIKWQFKQIINFYRKHASGKISKDSNLQHIFDSLDSKMNDLNAADGDEPDEPEEEEDKKSDEPKVGFRHIDMINGAKNEKYILIVEEEKYDEFLEHLSKNSTMSAEEVCRRIDLYNEKLDKNKASEECGVYRTITLTSFKTFDDSTYINKLNRLTT